MGPNVRGPRGIAELAREWLLIVATCDKFATSALWVVEITDPLMFPSPSASNVSLG